MATRKIRNTWWVDFQINYTRYRKKSPFNSRGSAKEYEAFLRQKLARGESLTDLKQEPEKPKITFKEFAWKWFETYVKTNNKASEVSHKRYALENHLIPFFGKTLVDKVTALQIEQYKTEKTSSGLKNKTVNNHLIVLGTCLRMAQEWLGIEKIPKIRKLKIPPQKFDFLTIEESDRLLANSEGMYREIIFTALKTGLRRGELKALSWTDIEWLTRTITIKHNWSEAKKGLDTPKSNRERHIKMTSDLYEMLNQRFNQREQKSKFVFPRFDNKRLSQEISRACQKAGIREITCHTLRHSFASHLAMAGAPLKAIQELLGHANIQTTMIYAHLSHSSLDETIDLLDPAKRFSENFVNRLSTRHKFSPPSENGKISKNEKNPYF